MLDKIKNYVNDHRAEMVVYGIMTAIIAGIGIAAGMHPLDALARNRSR